MKTVFPWIAFPCYTRRRARNKDLFTEDFMLHLLQPTFTCSNLTIETQEQGLKYVQS